MTDFGQINYLSTYTRSGYSSVSYCKQTANKSEHPLKKCVQSADHSGLTINIQMVTFYLQIQTFHEDKKIHI